MKRYIYILAALSMAPTFALAQSIDSDVDAELDQMYSGAAPKGRPVSQPIYILNQATPTSTATATAVNEAQQTQSNIQKQPTTVIEASPLIESRAEQIRRSRQDAEVATEQRIVEKLEQSRMEDERKRADLLFGNRLNNNNNNNNQQAPPVQQVPVQQIQPIYVQQPAPAEPVVVEPKEDTRAIIREELASAMKVEEAMPVGPVETMYVAGLLGVGDYPDSKQVQGNYAMGVAFGTKYDNFIIEGSFLFSNYTVSGQGYYTGNAYGYSNHGGNYVPDSIDVAQYSGSLAAKVQLFSGIIKPVFGGLVAYSYRAFSWDNNNYMGYVNDTKANSHAIDVGTLVGVDLEFSPKYSIGLDFRYMWNLSSRVNGGNTWMSRPQYGTPIEKLQYYTMSIAGKVNF